MSSHPARLKATAVQQLHLWFSCIFQGLSKFGLSHQILISKKRNQHKIYHFALPSFETFTFGQRKFISCDICKWVLADLARPLYLREGIFNKNIPFWLQTLPYGHMIPAM